MIGNAMVQKLAAAAHIDLAREEIDRMAVQLSDILELLAPLAQVSAEGGVGDADAAADANGASADARGADADANAAATDARAAADVRVASAVQPLRADELGADRLHGTLSRFAPEVRDGFFVVPLLPSHGGSAS